MLLLRRALVLTETRVISCRSMDCGPLPGLTVREESVTLSNLPVTILDSAVAMRIWVPEERDWTVLQPAAGWAAAVTTVKRTAVSAQRTFGITRSLAVRAVNNAASYLEQRIRLAIPTFQRSLPRKASSRST
jgi:hypothetical protein